MATYQSFEEMPVWQKAHKLAVEVFRVSEGFPRKEDYGLTSQLRRAALSISAVTAQAVILSGAKNLGSNADEILRRKKRSSE